MGLNGFLIRKRMINQWIWKYPIFTQTHLLGGVSGVGILIDFLLISNRATLQPPLLLEVWDHWCRRLRHTTCGWAGAWFVKDSRWYQETWRIILNAFKGPMRDTTRYPIPALDECLYFRVWACKLHMCWPRIEGKCGLWHSAPKLDFKAHHVWTNPYAQHMTLRPLGSPGFTCLSWTNSGPIVCFLCVYSSCFCVCVLKTEV